MRKTIIGLGTSLLILYVGICVYFYSIQNLILFKPGTLPESHSYNYAFDFEERWFDVEDGARIHAIHAKTADSVRGLVFFIHGNAGNNNTRPLRYQFFLDQGFDVIYPDYRGYGKSNGSLKNEDDLVGDMNIIYQQMMKEYDEDRISLIGYSLGSGIAALVAARNDPAKLILWTPYYSMIDLKNDSYPFLPSFLVRYPLRTDLALQQIEEPITIFYAENDDVLPVDRSIRLTEFLDENDQYFMLEDQGHNYLLNNERLREELVKIFR